MPDSKFGFQSCVPIIKANVQQYQSDTSQAISMMATCVKDMLVDFYVSNPQSQESMNTTKDFLDYSAAGKAGVENEIEMARIMQKYDDNFAQLALEMSNELCNLDFCGPHYSIVAAFAILAGDGMDRSRVPIDSVAQYLDAAWESTVVYDSLDTAINISYAWLSIACYIGHKRDCSV
jgi:hypothetical protein